MEVDDDEDESLDDEPDELDDDESLDDEPDELEVLDDELDPDVERASLR